VSAEAAVWVALGLTVLVQVAAAAFVYGKLTGTVTALKEAFYHHLNREHPHSLSRKAREDQ